jgi:hypothetical protein
MNLRINDLYLDEEGYQHKQPWVILQLCRARSAHSVASAEELKEAIFDLLFCMGTSMINYSLLDGPI